MVDPGAGSEAKPNGLFVPSERLESLERLAGIGAVASSVAHEFNNILTAILNHAKLGTRSTDPEATRRAFEKILDSARRASKITTGILALARNRSSRPENTDIVTLVEQVLVVCDKDLRKHQIRLECDFPSRPKARIVASQIEQVVLNLVINARQAMAHGGVLTLGVRENRESGVIEIMVRDTGCGIAAANLPKIFEPFFTTKSGPDESGQGGSGLGLSLCKEIVSRHHGRIRVESLVGKGTTFTVKLPIAPPTIPSQAA